jgi:AcrR family transcriptional regulator
MPGTAQVDSNNCERRMQLSLDSILRTVYAIEDGDTVAGRTRTQAARATTIWLRPRRSARGPKPAHDRDQIAAAAVRRADAGGLGRVSMRELARHLGIGAASLYRYVENKDELFDLMVDHVMGEEVPPAATGQWRADLRAIACRTRGILLRHPWMITVTAFRTSLGPNNLRWLERTLASVDKRGLDTDQMLVIANTLLIFVRGYVMGELREQEASRQSGLSREQWMALQAPYGKVIEDSGEYPVFCRMIHEAKAPHAPDLAERAFATGLDYVLDGFAARMPRRGASAATRTTSASQRRPRTG